MTGQPPDDPIELLREQIRVATAAAERLLHETRAGTGAPRVAGADPAADPPPPEAGSVPPSGWATPESAAQATSELQALAQLFAAVRHTLPDEIVQQIVDLIRQLLLIFRALIDWAVARMERGSRGSDVLVEDIPIT